MQVPSASITPKGSKPTVISGYNSSHQKLKNVSSGNNSLQRPATLSFHVLMMQNTAARPTKQPMTKTQAKPNLNYKISKGMQPKAGFKQNKFNKLQK